MTIVLPFRTAALALALSLSLPLAACDSGGDMPRTSGNGEPTPRDQIECTASIEPALLSYEVDDDLLTLRSGGDELVLEREDLGSSVFGLWGVPGEDVGGPFGLFVSGTFDIVANRVTITAYCSSTIGTTFAQATSRAIIDDSTIELLESDSQTKRIVR